MIDLIQQWQELLSGLLTLVAGGFIFLQGNRERKFLERQRVIELQKEKDRALTILNRLLVASSQLNDELIEQIDLLEDVFTAIDRGDQNIDLPTKTTVPKIFETIFAQITTQNVPVETYLKLSTMLEKSSDLDEDYRRFAVLYSQSVTEHRSMQARLPLGVPTARSSDEPAAQTLLISTRALQEVVSELSDELSGLVKEGDSDGRYICSSQQRVEAVQHVESREGSRQERTN